MRNIVVTGGAGFVGSHVAEHFLEKGNTVIVFDNLSRAQLMHKEDAYGTYNWNYLKKYENAELTRGDVRNPNEIGQTCKDADLIVHTAAQTAVTASLIDPETDFAVNAYGTFNVLEAARKSQKNPAIVFCSTNKVYGENVNSIPVKEDETRWSFSDERFKAGVSESFPIDSCGHTPYGCSKLAADIYVQDYAHTYGLRTGIFRMSCVYGERQFGLEDQGWLAWFAIATLTDRPLTIFGDGKQVRDVLYVGDLVRAFEAFAEKELRQEVFNMGGGPANTLSLLELLSLLKELTGRNSPISYREWRPFDQKVYVSDTSKARETLGWHPKVNVREGVKRLVAWINENIELFK